jgi:hypothetical protein
MAFIERFIPFIEGGESFFEGRIRCPANGRCGMLPRSSCAWYANSLMAISLITYFGDRIGETLL